MSVEQVPTQCFVVLDMSAGQVRRLEAQMASCGLQPFEATAIDDPALAYAALQQHVQREDVRGRRQPGLAPALPDPNVTDVQVRVSRVRRDWIGSFMTGLTLTRRQRLASFRVGPTDKGCAETPDLIQ